MKASPLELGAATAASGPSFATILQNTTGSLFLGFLISAALMGVTYAQACVYFRQRFRTDACIIRFTVIAILFLETAHIVLASHGVYTYTVIDHANPALLANIVWSTIISTVPATVVVSIVQYVWIMRIYTLNRSVHRKYLAGSMIFMCLAEAGLSLTWAAMGVGEPTWWSPSDVQTLLTLAFTVRCFNDSAITSLLIFHLRRARNGIQKTDGMIHTMLAYGLNAGLIACCGSIVIIILIVVESSTSFYYVAVYMVLSKVYGISLMAIVNWRSPQDNMHPSDGEDDSTELSTARDGIFTGASLILTVDHS
ncbi:hypothetical protein FIBSPDRAFT_1035624 [Athelia psychrophila]|uniref:DUF6534 domain-containing protein n=1 Tax=Athelia psychrophila TaxID=1759441 RepID=A0A166XC01_9AGAM|nr:hypothetical protein FIBSPDRAFT_1035624 [Fibularhizoctonia sp. CBS 109695]